MSLHMLGADTMTVPHAMIDQIVDSLTDEEAAALGEELLTYDGDEDEDEVGFDWADLVKTAGGVLSTAGGVMGPSGGTDPKQAAAQAQMALAQEKMREEAAASQTRMILWGVGGLTALAVIGIILAKVLGR